MELFAFAWFMLAISLQLAAYKAPRPVQQRFRRYLFVGATIAAGGVFWIGWDVAFQRPVAGQYSVGAALILVIFILSGLSDWNGRLLSARAVREDASLLFGRASTWILAALTGAAFTIGSSATGTSASGAPMGPAFVAWYEAQPRVALSPGLATAPVVIVKFVDYQCPACRAAERYYSSMFDSLGERFPGQILILTYDFPLGAECNEVSLISHTAACAAAVVMRQARISGRGAAVEEWLWNNQEILTRESILTAAMNFGVQTGVRELYNDLLEQVRADALQAARIGVNGTPMYMVNGVLFGFVPRRNFEAVVLHELSRVGMESFH